MIFTKYNSLTYANHLLEQGLTVDEVDEVVNRLVNSKVLKRVKNNVLGDFLCGS